MIISDLHMHSAFSTDSDSDMSVMVQKAIDLGLKTIAFTEHVDIDFPTYPEYGPGPQFLCDVPKYKAYLDLMREKYADKINILFGIELGLMKSHKEGYDFYPANYDFDFIIGSSHQVWGYGEPYDKEYFDNAGSDDKGYRIYFESILENLNTFNYMNTYAHLDYVVRYGASTNKNFTYEKYADILDAVLDKIIEKEIALEVNSAGFHYKLGNPHPNKEIIKRYYEKGGRLITIGSDAHSPERISKYFDMCEDVLKDIGFKSYMIFNRGKVTEYGF